MPFHKRGSRCLNATWLREKKATNWMWQLLRAVSFLKRVMTDTYSEWSSNSFRSIATKPRENGSKKSANAWQVVARTKTLWLAVIYADDVKKCSELPKGVLACLPSAFSFPTLHSKFNLPCLTKWECFYANNCILPYRWLLQEAAHNAKKLQKISSNYQMIH